MCTGFFGLAGFDEEDADALDGAVVVVVTVLPLVLVTITVFGAVFGWAPEQALRARVSPSPNIRTKRARREILDVFTGHTLGETPDGSALG
jgi:hypothetical protein